MGCFVFFRGERELDERDFWVQRLSVHVWLRNWCSEAYYTLLQHYYYTVLF